MRIGILALVTLVLPVTARGACNLIPATDRTFLSTLGIVSTPVAAPGQAVTVRRDTQLFSSVPGENTITLTFRPVGGPETVMNVPAMAPASATSCDPATDCTGGTCRCVRFAFPDTDADVGGPADGHGLTGPVDVEIETASVVTAAIDALYLAPGVRDSVFPSFTALPPANPLSSIGTGPGGELLTAPDDFGNLFIPSDFTAISQPDLLQTRFVDVTVPPAPVLNGLTIESYTPDGRRLPPLIRNLGTGAFVGTADAPASVLRVAGGATAIGVPQESGKGPIVIPGVTGASDPKKRGDIFTIVGTEGWVVYENRECGLQDPTSECLDLNGDTDQSDYFLLALDLSTPGATPITIDEVDATDFAGYPAGFALAALYKFVVTDSLVVFEIGEGTIADINDDGDMVDIIKTGAYDLTRAVAVPQAANSVRLEIGGDLLVFAETVDAPNGEYTLQLYDAAAGSPGPALLHDATYPQLFVFIHPAFVASGITALSPSPLVIGVADGRVAVAVDEIQQGTDVSGNGFASDAALVVYDHSSGTITSTQQEMDPFGFLRLGDRWLVYETLHSFTPQSWGLLPAASPLTAPQIICDGGAQFRSTFVLPPSDAMIPCMVSETGAFGAVDDNEDGDETDQILRVYLPDPPVGPAEVNLHLALNGSDGSFGVPVMRADVLAVGVDEAAQGQDLDASGLIMPGPPSIGLLYRPSLAGNPLASTRVPLLGAAPPALTFIDGGLSLVTPDIRRTFLRDLDGDTRFEESLPFGPGGALVLDDNCPSEPNPDQADADGDGLGDACDPQTCGNGVVEPGESCDVGPTPTLTCLRCVAACTSSPRAGCRTTLLPKKSVLGLVDLTDEKDKLGWKWKGQATALADFGTPPSDVGEAFHLCLYSAGVLVSRTSASTPALWTAKGTKGFAYAQKPSLGVKLSAGADHKAKVQVKAKGIDVDMPDTGALANPVRAQLVATKTGVCWEGTYSAPFKLQANGKFKDTSD